MFIATDIIMQYNVEDTLYTLAKFEVDTASNLPTSTTDSKISIGSEAHVIDTNSKYCMGANDTWMLQEAGTASYTKAEVDAIIESLDAPTVGGSGKYISEIYETDGVIHASQATIQTSVNTSNNAVSSNAVKNYVDDSILSLDATSVGGSGKYISEIYEQDGIIHATPTTIETSVNTSTDAVSSNAVKTYVDNGLANKITIADVFSTGVSLANYNSLDNLDPGNYYAENGTVANAVGAPYNRSGFNLWVMATNNTTRRVQFLFPNPNGSDYYTKGFILFRQEVAGTWEDWHTLTDVHGLGNSVVVGASGINLDTIKTEGVWYSASTTGAQASAGRPDYSSSGAKVWRLDVYKMYSTRAWQELTVYRLGTSEGEFDKYFRMNKTDNTWTDWQHVDTTTIGTYYPQTLQSISPQVMSVNPVNQINEVDEVTDDEIDDEMR